MTATTGRPLRFLLLVLLCWTAGRILFTWPQPGVQTADAADAALFAPRNIFAIASTANPRRRTSGFAMAMPARFPIPAAAPDTGRILGKGVAAILRVAIIDTSPAMAVMASAEPIAVPPVPIDNPASTLIKRDTPPARRWTLDSWLFWRQGNNSSPGLSGTGQLGASQAGTRLQYDLTSGRAYRIAAYGRLTSALQSPAAPEAALGIAWQPRRSLPLSFAIERRARLGRGGRNAFAAMAVTGFGPVDIPLGLRSEGYAQAGVVGLRRRDAFIDGKLSVLAPLTDRIGAGVAVSGGAQPHLGRFDIGPEIQARLPIAPLNPRLSAEWRQRVVGNARPGSGLAVTLSAGF
jgi:hypothetical protein